MFTKTRMSLLSATLAMLVLAPQQASAESTICTGIITSLPFTINTASGGTWCLNSSLTYSSSTGNAITVNGSSVTIDFNGFRINAPAATTNNATGVFAADRKNVVIKNGSIRRFRKAIVFDEVVADGSRGNIVEDMRIDFIFETGIEMEGTGNVVRNCQLVDIGGSTIGGVDDANGVIMDGAGSRAINNDVSDLTPEGAGVARAFVMRNSSGSVLENNRIGNGTLFSTATGIDIESGDVQVIGSRITTMQFGINFTGGTGKYRDNLTSGVTTSYTGGSDAGNNN